jgi:uncharacterized membrane protein
MTYQVLSCCIYLSRCFLYQSFLNNDDVRVIYHLLERHRLFAVIQELKMIHRLNFSISILNN